MALSVCQTCLHIEIPQGASKNPDASDRPPVTEANTCWVSPHFGSIKRSPRGSDVQRSLGTTIVAPRYSKYGPCTSSFGFPEEIVRTTKC